MAVFDLPFNVIDTTTHECEREACEVIQQLPTALKEAALENADALVVCTEWQCFKAPNYELILNKLNVPLIVDGRNLYDPVLLRQKGIEYIAIGRNNQRLVA